MEIAIILLIIALVAVVVLFIRERWAREDEQRQFIKDRKELRAWLAERPTKAEVDSQRWAAMHQAYRAGWNDALLAAKAAEEAEAQALAAKAAAKAKAKAERLTMK